MAVEVFAADEQDAQPVDLERWVALARDVLSARGVKGPSEVSLLFVDEDSIASLNEQFLARRGPTDVLAFPIEDDPAPGGRFPDVGGNGPGSEPNPAPLTLLGDVVICPAVAARNAPAHQGTYDDELALLVVHGLLHLLGMDHEVDEQAEKMERLEASLLARFHRPAAPAEAGTERADVPADSPPSTP